MLSVHSLRRFSSRYEGEDDVETVSRKASHYGIRPEQIPEKFDLYLFVSCRALKKNKAIRLFEGYVFVFSKNKRLITMYKLPPEYEGEYARIAHLETSNRERYRELKRKRI